MTYYRNINYISVMEKSWKQIKIYPDKPVKVFETNPFENDYLGFKTSVIRLSKLINRVRLPFTIGIYGDWGSGKTSFMKMLKLYIENEKEFNFKTFWFDAWEYENESSLLLPLLSKMAKESESKHREVFTKVKQIAASLILTGTDILVQKTTLGSINLQDIQKNISKFGNIYDSWVNEIENLKIEFKNLIDRLKENKKGVIIFIDDLDRCVPENVVRLIENIKHFLSVEGCKCIFILGVDKTVLEKGIQARYGSNLISGNEYLEKIINLSFTIPQYGLNYMEFIIKCTQEFCDPVWYKEISNKIKEFADILIRLGIENPRKIKRIILRYLLFLTLPEHEKYLPEIIIYLLVYREVFPEAYMKKKTKNAVHYFPELDPKESVTKSKIEAISCKDFAEIATNDKYKELRRFSEPVMTFVDLFGRDISSVKKALSSYKHRETVLRFSESYNHRHEDYFEMTDFLFSLS